MLISNVPEVRLPDVVLIGSDEASEITIYVSSTLSGAAEINTFPARLGIVASIRFNMPSLISITLLDFFLQVDSQYV